MEYLNCNKRVKKTLHDAKKERRQGMIPGILYAKHLNNLMFEISEIELNKEMLANGEHGLLNLSINGEEHRGLIKEVQRDPVNHKIIHIDIEDLSGDKVITTEVPIFFNGEDNIVRNGGILQKEKSILKVQCKVDSLPKHIDVYVSDLKVGDTLRIRDVEMSSEISFVDDKNTVIAAVTDTNTHENGENPEPEAIIE